MLSSEVEGEVEINRQDLLQFHSVANRHPNNFSQEVALKHKDYGFVEKQ
jgi:hypothetical protein